MFEEQWREVFFFCPLWALFPLGQVDRLFAFLVNWHLGKRAVVREIADLRIEEIRDNNGQLIGNNLFIARPFHSNRHYANANEEEDQLVARIPFAAIPPLPEFIGFTLLDIQGCLAQEALHFLQLSRPLLQNASLYFANLEEFSSRHTHEQLAGFTNAFANLAWEVRLNDFPREVTLLDSICAPICSKLEFSRPFNDVQMGQLFTWLHSPMHRNGAIRRPSVVLKKGPTTAQTEEFVNKCFEAFQSAHAPSIPYCIEMRQVWANTGGQLRHLNCRTNEMFSICQISHGKYVVARGPRGNGQQAIIKQLGYQPPQVNLMIP